MSDPSSSNASILEITSKIMISAVIVSFIVIVFIFLLHLYARCLWSVAPEDPEIVSWRRQLATQNQRSADPGGRRPRGLDKATLRSLPAAEYDPAEFKEGLECSVCLSELQRGEKARVLPICKHGFHLECIDVWFKSHSTCPICRTVVEASSGPDSVPVDDVADDSVQSSEPRAFPTNVLFWGDETRMEGGPSASSSSSGKPEGGLVIDIPAQVGVEEEAQSPVMARIKSLRRLLSRGKKVGPSPGGSSSGFGDAEQV